MAPAAVTLLQSVLVGVLGDFHFQALRIYTREQKLLHGYYMYEVTVQRAGGTFRAGPSGRGAEVCRLSRRGGDVSRQPHQPCHAVHLEECVISCLNFPHDQLFSSLVFQKKVAQSLLKDILRFTLHLSEHNTPCLVSDGPGERGGTLKRRAGGKDGVLYPGPHSL